MQRFVLQFYHMFVYLCICVCHVMHVEPEDTLQELALYPSTHIGPGDQT